MVEQKSEHSSVIPRTHERSLSVVVVTYQMDVQLRNTLLSLTPPYQQGLGVDDHEIVVVDNGSPEPQPESLWRVAPSVEYVYLPPDRASPNPGAALNIGVRRARAPVVCLMIDGARMVTPGVLGWGLRLTRLSPTAVTEVRRGHLGSAPQYQSIDQGYTEKVERELLASVDWYTNGYRLFDIAVPVGPGFHGRVKESNCVFLHRALFDHLGGFDERYAHPGGGLVNHDFFWRAVTAAESVFVLLGEANVHQMHGGAATALSRGPARRAALSAWRDEYSRLSRPFDGEFPPYRPILAGHLPEECRPWLSPDARSERAVG